MSWIKIDREIQNHWIWQNSDYLKAWICLIITVNFEPKKVFIQGELILCERGQSLISLSGWVKKFGSKWTIQRVRTFFELLKDDKMITTEGLHKTTRLTICNYEVYQLIQQTDNTPITNKQQTDNTPITTTKEREEYKELKKENKNINILLSELKISDITDKNTLIAFSFWELISKNLLDLKINSPTIKKATVKNWVEPIRLMVEIDKRTRNEIAEVYTFLKTEVPKNGFSWKQNILSTKKLREKFDKLLIESRNINFKTNKPYQSESTQRKEAAENLGKMAEQIVIKSKVDLSKI